MRKNTLSCQCRIRFSVRIGRAEDYQQAKNILNRGHHPTYIGPHMVRRSARNGGLIFFDFHSERLAVAVINAHHNILLVLNVIPEHRSHGLGTAIMQYLQVNWVRAIESAVPFFEHLGYIKIGEPKQGRQFITWLMVRKDLIELSGRLRALLSPEWNH